MICEYKADPLRCDALNVTPLHCAAFAGSHACCDVLRRYGGHLNAADVNKRTPISIAPPRLRKTLVEWAAERDSNQSDNSEPTAQS